MKDKIKALLAIVANYFLEIGRALIGKNIKKWNVFYIGELGVTQLTFMPGAFHPQDRLFLKAEKVPGLAKGTINDCYNQMKVDREHRVAIYCKEIVDNG